MARSMTGFGSGAVESGGLRVKVEIRAVNHRFLEINARLPRPYLLLEEKIRQRVSQVVSRGHIDIFITIEQERAKKRQIKVDNELVMAYYVYLREIAQYLDIPADIGLRELMSLPGAVEMAEVEEEPEDVWPAVAGALDQGLEQLVAARDREGQRLTTDLQERLHRLAGYVEEIDSQKETMLAGYRQRLQARAQELLGPAAADGERLLEEVVFFAERSDITEEIVRLRSHLAEMPSWLLSKAPVGRKLDFLAQEMNREINTVGAKAASGGISQLVVACKEEIERIREQVQNLE